MGVVEEAVVEEAVEPPPGPPEAPPGPSEGYTKTAPAPFGRGLYLCWNFEGPVPTHSGGYRDELKTPCSYLIGAHFGDKACQEYGCLRLFKMVLLVILALLSDLQGKLFCSGLGGGQTGSGPPAVGPPGSDFRSPGGEKMCFFVTPKNKNWEV